MNLTFLDANDTQLAKFQVKRTGSVYYWLDATSNTWRGPHKTKESLLRQLQGETPHVELSGTIAKFTTAKHSR